MSFFDKLKINRASTSTRKSSGAESEKSAAHAETTPVDSDDDSINKEAQAGVQKAEATTSVWSNSHLFTAYIMCDPPMEKHRSLANDFVGCGLSISLAQCSKA
jgi:hypothetical protein